ncbi:PrgI family protein [Patescibacteria group bacterium]|nr:PrgI family protein [Patescibacteria group bacterium]
MKEHAIPQDITGYKFHIVGNMTLKQFAEIALGFVVAFFIYKTNLIAPVKWTLAILSASFGAALAFLPIEERPLDHWFITFFTILYKPTKFYWKKHTKVPEAFLYTSSQDTKNQINEVDLSPQRRERITEYLQSVKTTTNTDEFEETTRLRSTQLLSIFDDHTLQVDFTKAEKLLKKPKLKVAVRSLVEIEEKQEKSSSPENNIVEDKAVPVFQDYQAVINATPTKTYKVTPKNIVSTDQVATQIVIPKAEEIKVEDVYQNEQRKIGVDISDINQKNQVEQMAFTKDEAVAKDQAATSSVLQNKDLPFPIKPTKPNKLVGMILSQDSDLINQATVSLKDEQGTPVTAVKSNALGQFFVTSQLPNGTYTIEITKEDLSFNPVQLTLSGKVVDPLEIRSNE